MPMIDHKPYKQVVAALLNQCQPRQILDAPCGTGWLLQMLNYGVVVDGLDLFETWPRGYREFRASDLDMGLPADLGMYDAIVSCEGIEHFGNPECFFRSARERLNPGGLLLLTTPNTWHSAAKWQYLLRGYFPGFPCLVGKIKRGSHMHIMPWSFAHLYLYLTLSGFENITLHDIDEPKPKRLFEWLLGLPHFMYCRHKRNTANEEEVRRFWSQAGSRQSLFGRRLVVSARVASC